METKSFSKRVSIADLWGILTRRIWIMLIAALVVTVGVKIYESQIKVPLYESTATLYILRRDNEVNYSYTQSDFKLALDVVNDCTYVLKSSEVLREVQDQLHLNLSVVKLSQRINTNNPENTRFLEISVVDESPEMARRIVNCLCDKGSVKIEESMGFDQVNIYSYGEAPTKPSNMMGFFAYLLLGLIVMLVIYSGFLLAFFLDNNLKTPEDISRHLGISLLAEIPNSESKALLKNGKYRYQKRYQYTNRVSSEKDGGRRDGK